MSRKRIIHCLSSPHMGFYFMYCNGLCISEVYILIWDLLPCASLDKDTVKLMNTPRCSLPDIIGSEDMLKKRRRKRRYATTGLRWTKSELTWRSALLDRHGHWHTIVYNNIFKMCGHWLTFCLLSPSIQNYPSLPPPLQPSQVNTIIAYALKAWSDVTNLKFHDTSPSERDRADIKISFVRSLHDDGYPFDGRGGTLAHAFFPGEADVAGDTHFDDEESWTYLGKYLN